MEIKDERRFVYTCKTASYREFIEFWAPWYEDDHEELYTGNIRGPHTSETLHDLFSGK